MGGFVEWHNDLKSKGEKKIDGEIGHKITVKKWSFCRLVTANIWPNA